MHDGSSTAGSRIVRLCDLVGSPGALPTPPVSEGQPSGRDLHVGTAAGFACGRSARDASSPIDRPATRAHLDAAPEIADLPDADLVPYEGLFGPGGDAKRRQPRPAKPPATAAQRAIGLLSRREHSRKELTQKLVTRGLDPTEVDAAVAKLANAGWQDDRRFAESLVRARAAIGHGPLRIRAELGTHGLAPGVGEAAMDVFEGDWAEIARDAVLRRFGRIEDPRLRERKAADFLLRRGFPADIAFPASRADPSA